MQVLQHDAMADPVCRGYTLTRLSHGLDGDLVPLTCCYWYMIKQPELNCISRIRLDQRAPVTWY
jgi:hypothetical protein